MTLKGQSEEWVERTNACTVEKPYCRYCVNNTSYSANNEKGSTRRSFRHRYPFSTSKRRNSNDSTTLNAILAITIVTNDNKTILANTFSTHFADGSSIYVLVKPTLHFSTTPNMTIVCNAYLRRWKKQGCTTLWRKCIMQRV